MAKSEKGLKVLLSRPGKFCEGPVVRTSVWHRTQPSLFGGGAVAAVRPTVPNKLRPRTAEASRGLQFAFPLVKPLSPLHTPAAAFKHIKTAKVSMLEDMSDTTAAVAPLLVPPPNAFSMLLILRRSGSTGGAKT